MIQTCKHCGAVNEEHAERCSFCHAQLSETAAISTASNHAAPVEAEPTPVIAGQSESVEPAVAVQPEWRREVAHRVQAYRARYGLGLLDRSHPTLPFNARAARDASEPSPPAQGEAARAPLFEPTRVLESKTVPIAEGAAQENSALPAAGSRPRSRAPGVERVEINVAQPHLDFAAAEALRSRPSAELFPVARLEERRRAGLADAGFLLLAYAAVLGLFKSLGGQFTFGKIDAFVYGATLFLLYAQYFALFTSLGGSTPGMLLRGLRVVRFDGGAPTPGQLLWRSFGYVISAGTVFLGFLWALWDEDQLTWQDRLSQTYVTETSRLTDSEPNRVTA